MWFWSSGIIATVDSDDFTVVRGNVRLILSFPLLYLRNRGATVASSQTRAIWSVHWRVPTRVETWRSRRIVNRKYTNNCSHDWIAARWCDWACKYTCILTGTDFRHKFGNWRMLKNLVRHSFFPLFRRLPALISFVSGRWRYTWWTTLCYSTIEVNSFFLTWYEKRRTRQKWTKRQWIYPSRFPIVHI